MKLHDWRLLPLAVGVWTGALVGTSASLAGIVGALVLGLAAGVGVRRKAPWLALGCVAFALLSGLAGLLALQRAQSDLANLANNAATVRAEVRIVSEPKPLPDKPPRPPSGKALVQVAMVEGRGVHTRQSLPAQLRGTGEQLPELLRMRVGASYLVEVRLRATDAGDAVVAQMQLRNVRAALHPPGLMDKLAGGLRDGLRRSVEASPDVQRALVPSLVVGDTSRITQAMSDDFEATGLTHLLAVSGANLALMLSVILASLRFAGVRGWAVRAAAVGGVAMFVIVCGPEPSVQRAAAMGLVSLAATGVGTGRRSIRGLCVAVVALMALDPWLSRAPGFWLSSSACLGIVVLGPPFIQALTRWAPRWLAEALAIPLAAQILTQPIITWLSGQVSIVGVLTNVVAGPFVGPTTVLGFAAACTCFLPPLSSLLGWLAGWSAQPIVWIASAGASVPNATIDWIPGALGLILITLACASLTVVVQPVLRRWWATVLFVSLLAWGSFWQAPTPGWPGNWDAVFCDVGQGDAVVLRADTSTAVLVDTGPDPGPVLACLNRLGIQQIPVVVLTHFHADHVGAFAAVVRRFQPKLVLVSPMESPAEEARRVRQLARQASLRTTGPGDEFSVGFMRWTTISAWQPRQGSYAAQQGESSEENDSSIVGVAEVRGLRLLLAGDVEPAGQREALRQARRHGLSVQAHVLKLPHHGSARQDPEFFASTGAALAVASSGEDNAYGHPASKALELAAHSGMAMARTDEEGSLALQLDGRIHVRRTGK
ncbi:MAG: ComEC/Rec2 family competence protein [Propionibacteriaceae bacterium]|nr:ComEC/Rec2 family competence protein [Propionibacteriaceae bacterium]